MSWQIQEAKSKFSYVVNEAVSKGPQIITRHGKEIAVIISMDDFRQLSTPPPTLLDLLLSSPLSGSGLDIRRDQHDTGRVVEL